MTVVAKSGLSSVPTLGDVGLATPLRDATDAGLAAVADGGNAIDAALTAAAFLTVAYPHNCAIGGDLLALVREPDGTTTFINASGRSPQELDVAKVRATHKSMPMTGPHSVTVPGLVSGWSAMHAKGASHTWSQTLQPAIDAAEEGVTVSRGLAIALDSDWSSLSQNRGMREVFAPDGELATLGSQLRQPALARTMRLLADGGPDQLYLGDIGRELVDGLQQLGCALTVQDLASHRVTEQTPLELSVDGWRVLTARPNSQGFVLLRLLGMLNQVDEKDSLPLVERVPVGVLANAFLQTIAERDSILADPLAMRADVDGLLTKESLQALLDVSGLDQSIAAVKPRRRPDGDTVAVAAADADGRSVSLIQSVYYGFGSQLLEPVTGVVMHNRGSCFSLDPDSPNVLAPGKRPAHTLTPVLAERGDQRLAVGTMGGEMQPQILTQVLSRLFSGQTPQQAVASPRWTAGPWDLEDPPNSLSWEQDVHPGLASELAKWTGPRGELNPMSSRMGHAQAVRVRGSAVESGTDPRADPFV